MSKRLKQVQRLIDQDKEYPIEEAVKLARKTSTVKFDASVEVHMNLNTDPKKTEQRVRTTVTLPHGTGKKLTIAAFATPAKEKEAKEAGADVVGGEELIKRIKSTEKTDFDIAVAEPAMMPKLAQIAKILGQRKLMPTPKTDTVGDNVGQMIKALKTGKIDIKTDDSGNIHQIIGKASFADEELVKNYETLKQAVLTAKPDGVKDNFLKRITLTTSMGPAIKIET